MQTRCLATLNRRTSLSVLAALGAAGVAASEPSSLLGKNSARKKSRKRCKKDTDACISTLTAACADDDDQTTCVSTFTPCCETCSANGFFSCYLSKIRDME